MHFEEFCLLGCATVQYIESQVTFRRNVKPLHSGSKDSVLEAEYGHAPPKRRQTFNVLHGIAS
jgi:hypothetical protein